MKVSITDVATTMRTRFDGEVGWDGEDMRLGVVLFLPAKKQHEIFNTAEDEDYDGTKGADHEHRFENAGYCRDEQSHMHTMLFEILPVDQFE
jgi:hypothetical protein